jgi:hypothetical protein
MEDFNLRESRRDDEDDGVEYELAPPEVDPEQARPEPPRLERDVEEIWEESYRAQSGDGRYTTRDLLAATAAAAVVLTLCRLFSPAITAAIMGVLVLLGLVALSDEQVRTPRLQLMWWTMLLVYLILSAWAALAK